MELSLFLRHNIDMDHFIVHIKWPALLSVYFHGFKKYGGCLRMKRWSSCFDWQNKLNKYRLFFQIKIPIHDFLMFLCKFLRIWNWQTSYTTRIFFELEYLVIYLTLKSRTCWGRRVKFRVSSFHFKLFRKMMTITIIFEFTE